MSTEETKKADLLNYTNRTDSTELPEVRYTMPIIDFPAYEEYLSNATAVADHISRLVVTPDTVKDVKKTLADARRLTDRLDAFRIDIKKKILENYNVFESQVKEITGIVDAADKELRGKVKELEEQERANKKELIRDIWGLRILMYDDITQLIPDAFDRFFQTKYLNKTVTMKTIETDMTNWLARVRDDIESLSEMGQDYTIEYAQCLDFKEAVQRVKAREEIKAAVADMECPVDKEPAARFTVIGRKDIKLTKALLEENEIEYKMEEI